MVVSITETFTGLNNATPTNFVGGISGPGSSATIQNNAYRLRTVGGINYDGAYKNTRKYTSQVDDFDEIIELWDGDVNEKYIYFAYRADSLIDGLSGYFLRIGGGTLNLEKVTSYTGVVIGTATFTLPPMGVHYWVRVQAVGSSHKIKFWSGSAGAQPTTGGIDGFGWQISLTDATYTTGSWGFSANIGGASLTRDFYVDNIAPASSASNIAPVANAGVDQANKTAATLITLNGSGSTDSDGSVASYAWTQISGPTVLLSSTTAASPTFIAPSVVGGTTIVMSLVVTDNLGLVSSADTVSIGVLTSGSTSVAWRSSSQSPAFGPTTSTTLTKPAGVVSGDILVAILKSEFPTAKTLTIPAGWSLLCSASAGNEMYGYVLWKRAGASEPATYVVSWTESDPWSTGTIQAYSGAIATGDPWGGFGQNVDFQTFIESVSYNAANSGLGVWMHTSWADNANPIEPSGYTKRGTTSTWASIAIADRNDTTTGAKTTGQGVTSAGSNQRYTFAGVLIPTGSTNSAPVVNAGVDQTNVEPFSAVPLTGSASDSDGTIASIAWNKVSGPTPITAFSSTTTLTPTYEAPGSLTGGTDIDRLTAVDNLGAVNTDDVAVTILQATEFTYAADGSGLKAIQFIASV